MSDRMGSGMNDGAICDVDDGVSDSLRHGNGRDTRNGCTLFVHHESGHSYKVKLAMEIAGVPHRCEWVDIFAPHARRAEPFRSLTPFGEVPLLLWDGVAHVQSNAILLLLAERLGRFGGEDGERLSRVREWLFWEANRIGLSLPHLRFARRFDEPSYPAGSLAWFEDRYGADVQRLERTLQDGRRFILDDQPSVADFSLCGYLYWADQAQLAVPPGVAGWLARLSALPGWGAPECLLPTPKV